MNRSLILAAASVLLLGACKGEKPKEAVEEKPKAQASSEPGTFKLSEESEKAIGFKTQAIGLGMAFDAIPVTGSLDAERDQPLTVVSSPAGGALESIEVSPGDAVGKGQAVARVAGKAVASPVLGTVADIKARAGETVAAGQPLLSILNLSKLTAYLDVYEDQIPKVRARQRVEVTVTAYAGKPFYGTIESFSQQINPQTRAAIAQVDVDNGEGKLRPGMSVEARILLPSKEKRLVVAASAVLYDSAGASWVYIQADAHTYSRRRVDLLPSPVGQQLIVKEGLKSGEVVVVQGAQELWGREFKGQLDIGEQGEGGDKD
ncbi:MAG: efflux RND transporter periplasmic adaptor subunit [Elusimicrobia bacterium]|nr:efflux RND transporter periplasmic adaptor subunit [Elusimicrobiota bacterium]MDE2424434.1 efflux RND transporter periplasmic adaptor subunit [Elusimicrobiota bacterium]